MARANPDRENAVEIVQAKKLSSSNLLCTNRSTRKSLCIDPEGSHDPEINTIDARKWREEQPKALSAVMNVRGMLTNNVNGGHSQQTACDLNPS
jgi:hypothetical protein